MRVTVLPGAAAAAPPGPAERYWRETLFELAGVDGHRPRVGPELYPTPVKLYPGHPLVPLPEPGHAGSLREAFGDGAGRGIPSELSDDVGSTLLHDAFGYSQATLDATGRSGVPTLHRQLASARCMYPSELYIWSAERGLSYYDPLHHALVPLRPGSDGAELAAALGRGVRDLTGALIVTSRFWKAAYRYAEYAYRLCCQEAGILIGHALLAAGSLGLAGHVRYRFADGVLSRWLGVDPAEESPMAVIPLGPGESAGLLEGVDVPDAAAEPALSAAAPGCAPFLEVEASARLSALLREPYAPVAASLPDGELIAVPATRLPDITLRSALARRTSGSLSHFVPTGAPMAAGAFWDLVRHGADPSPSDIAGAGAAPTALMLCANRVAGTGPGVYRRLAPEAVCRVWSGPVARRLAAAVLNPGIINFETTPAVVSIVGDPAAAGRALGDRGYRVLTMAAGIVAARVCVLAAAHGLGARVHNIYGAEATARLLGIAGPPGPVPLFQIALGALPVRPELRWGC